MKKDISARGKFTKEYHEYMLRVRICNRKQNDRIGVHFWSCQRRWR